jgi:hypothetical protein
LWPGLSQVRTLRRQTRPFGVQSATVGGKLRGESEEVAFKSLEAEWIRATVELRSFKIVSMRAVSERDKTVSDRGATASAGLR